jgi:hypothetical protein
LGAIAYGQPADAGSIYVGFGAVAVLCIAATLVPIEVALRRLASVERG